MCSRVGGARWTESLRDSVVDKHQGWSRALPVMALLLGGLSLRADGLEVAVGGTVGFTTQGPIPGSKGDNTTALHLRVGWDQSPSHLQMDQWQALAQNGSSSDLRYSVAGAGWQHSWWSEYHGVQAALGAELRVEQYSGHSSLVSGPSPLAGNQVLLVRPWLRGQVGFRGILLPLPYPAAELLGVLTQGGTYTHPFTRLEVAVPLWQQGGTGPSGLLRQTAPRWEASLQFGMRFGRSPK